MLSRAARLASLGTLIVSSVVGNAACVLDTVPEDLGLTPPGPGATVRYDLSAQPLAAIPLPNDTATWPDPTSRTGLRLNAGLIAPTTFEQQARERFARLEGWGTYAPITVSFDIDHTDLGYADYEGPALDLSNLRARQKGDDYDFADDAVYLINLETGLPQVIDVGAGSFSYLLERLDAYGANDTRRSERNLLFETIDETAGCAPAGYRPECDTDFDGILDVPGFEEPGACAAPDPICDDPRSGDDYSSPQCLEQRRERDRCIADNLLTGYERETDTLILRPLLPLAEMSRHAVVLTSRLRDGRGNPVRSPFEHIYHAAQRRAAEQVRDIINDSRLRSYFGDIAGTGLDHVAFVWSFTTQPTVDDLKRLRDGLYGQGPFARWAEEYPPALELQRAVGLTPAGAPDLPGWQDSEEGQLRGCPAKAHNLYKVDYEGLREHAERLLVEGLGLADDPATQLLLRRLEAVSHMVVATFRVPFLLAGGSQCSDPSAAFDLSFTTGEGQVTTDTVQLWLMIPKETAAHRQPFDVSIFAHGYEKSFAEQLRYAGNLAEHGIATAGFNAVGHGLAFAGEAQHLAALTALGSACYVPFFDALQLSRARDLHADGVADSGGDLWSGDLFHTRDSIRQSVLEQLQLVRLLRAFGEPGGLMSCPGGGAADGPCDVDADGQAEILGDFDADGTPDLGGPTARYTTWGESLGGILSSIHGAVDPYVTAAVPSSGGGGLSDISVRSSQAGLAETVLLRLLGPLVVTVPATDRLPCGDDSTTEVADHCTICSADQMSLRWVLPDVSSAGEVEIRCLEPGEIAGSTARIVNLDNDEVRCARVGADEGLRIGIPAATGDRIALGFWDGEDVVDSYRSCGVSGAAKLVIDTWGPGRFAAGSQHPVSEATCGAPSCSSFQGIFFGEGTLLTAPGHGLGHIRQTPALRRLFALAQAALDPADPISFAPYYAVKPMTDPWGGVMAGRAVLSLGVSGDMSMPLSSAIAFARASGAVPFLRPDQAALYPEHADYVTPAELFAALGNRTPNQDLIDRHVIEGVAALARHPAAAACAASANQAADDATFLDFEGSEVACFPSCDGATGSEPCYPGQQCVIPEGSAAGRCQPPALGQRACDEALFDTDDLDEGGQQYFEEAAVVPHRLARLSASVAQLPAEQIWAPRLQGEPGAADSDAYQPGSGRLTAWLSAYLVVEGAHGFGPGDPCQGFDTGTYLTNLVARFLRSGGTDLYYLSHPASHHCLATTEPSCAH